MSKTSITNTFLYIYHYVSHSVVIKMVQVNFSWSKGYFSSLCWQKENINILHNYIITIVSSCRLLFKFLGYMIEIIIFDKYLLKVTFVRIICIIYGTQIQNWHALNWFLEQLCAQLLFMFWFNWRNSAFISSKITCTDSYNINQCYKLHRYFK